MGVVGVGVVGEEIMRGVTSEYQHGREFCRRSLIPHIVVLSDKELFFERKQVRLRSLEANGKTSERVLGVAELPEVLLQQRHSTDRSDSVETQTTTRSGGGPSGSDSFPSNARPPVSVTVLSTSKLSGHNKRKIHDATLTKLLPLLETFPSKQPLEILVVDLKSDVLCSLAAEVNRKICGPDGGDMVSVVKSLTERYAKYLLFFIISSEMTGAQESLT
ncbi:hypothetical protein GBAR_LOCUS26010 [Geodia barretti]|uniref:Uncharacterized protein n=1 Tax=Geodia barretti TaxID=519541 RepID=A0AA35XC80_GEOBA|nr:hypothetical protein GBAR_LOCUS26010 [Geodia barretti]